ncbi:MAG: DMT family transporter [Desulfovibrio sp.]|nr:MAG: DMT family transporter [Desulfovibrio sp.]
MLWFFLSLFTAFAAATEAAIIKARLADLRHLEVMASPLVVSLPFFAAMVWMVERPETVDPAFWWNLALLVPINAAGFASHTLAIKLSPLSVTLPFLSVTPALVIVTGFLFLGELPGPWGAVGVFAIVVGGYVLNLDSGGKGALLGPIRAIAREKGSLLMLLAASIWGVAAVFGKLVVQQSSPLYGCAWFFLIHNTALLGALLATGKVRLGIYAVRWRPMVLLGLLFFVHVFCHFYALSLIEAVYMVSIKRLAGVFSVGYGWLLFRERHIGFRLAGAAIMTLGAAIIGLWG